nr:hypothetical protein [Protofrankia coriariae]
MGDRWGQRHGCPFPALADNPENPVPALHVEVVDVSGQDLTDAKTVTGQQSDQRVSAGAVGCCGGEQGAHLVTVQAGGLRVVTEPRAFDVGQR